MVDNSCFEGILNHMVYQDASPLDHVFHALSDPTRRAMLRTLAGGQRNLSELAAPFNMSFPAASKHVRVLETAGLVLRTVQGRTHFFQIRPAPLAAADEWLRFYESFWNEQLDALDAMLTTEDEATNTKSKKKGKER
jgi:DNA-binding transcriptional ArsR family regulator